jgi:hypothetical protein
MTLADFELSERQYLQSIWVALKRIEEALVLLVPPEPLALPAPIVRVEPPDLTDIVTAVQGLGGSQGPSASDIAEAIANVLRPPDSPPGSEEALAEVASAIKDLNFRLQGLGKQAYGGGSVSLTPADIAAISGLTNDELRAAPVPVSGTFYQATQPVSGTVTVSNPTTNPETGLAKDATLLRRFGDHVTKAGVVSTIGDNTLHTPTSGKKVRLYWIGLSTSQDNAAENLIQVKLTDADGTVKYRWCLGNPGAFVGGRTIEGSVNEPLILNLATTDAVNWNVDLEEVT